MHLTQEIIQAIDKVFYIAQNDGRDFLYEYEVYQILGNIGISVPKFLFISDPNQFKRANARKQLLKSFPREVVIKVVSPQIIHKQKVGGVKVIRDFNPRSLKEYCDEMKVEILSHFPEKNQPLIKGFLLVEFIPHSEALGYEVLIGCKEDPAFGPVLTLTKGGDDAEFFAAYYDPANLLIPPLDYDEALRMVHQLKIRHKFERIGHPEFMEYMARAISAISDLAFTYSRASRRSNAAGYLIKSLDINPLAITSDNRFIAIDGFAEFSETENITDMQHINTDNLEAFFHPKGIAVVGVSQDLAKFSLGRSIAHLLHDLGRKDLYLINVKGGTLSLGGIEYPLYKSLQEINESIDLVVYAAPASTTVEFISSLSASEQGPHQLKALILISGIPVDIKYAEFAARMDKVKPDGLRIIGPNCMGVFSAPNEQSKGLDTLFVDEERLELKSTEHSNTVILSQSGALALTSIDKLKNYRLFKAVVSFGNKYDVKITDLMAYFAGQKNIDLISLYIEGLDPGEGRIFFELARKLSKPVLVYKSGRTEAGAKAAASHTAAISGSYDIFRAACLQAGVILAEKLEDHYDYIKVFSLLAKKRPSGNRVAGVVNAGFESSVGADELKNLKQAQLSMETINKLKGINEYGLVDTTSPFLDITPMADDKMYSDYVELLLRDENVDCVFVAVVPHANTLKTTPETCHAPGSMANLLVDLGKRYEKPMVVSVNAGQHYQEFIAIMEEGGLPVYTDIRAAIKSLDVFITHYTAPEKAGI